MDKSTGTTLVSEVGAGRRTFFKGLGTVGLGATATLLFGDASVLKGQNTEFGDPQDTANQIFLAALVAEDLATTFYYGGLTGPVVEDPNLAGPGGTAIKPNPKNSNIPNLDYLRAALDQEIQHADLLRAVGNFGPSAASDPYQTFYFPAGTFDTLANFIATLEALENAFIGAYLNAIREFASLAARSAQRGTPHGPFGGPYSTFQLEYFAEVAGSILGVEAEHRVLGRVITNTPQANNLNYEQTDGLTSVYRGANSAVAALTPFLSPNNGMPISLATALADAPTIGLKSTGNPPPQVDNPPRWW